MRKTIFSFAIAAVAALAMAACTDGKSAANNGENADSAAVEETTDQVAEADGNDVVLAEKFSVKSVSAPDWEEREKGDVTVWYGKVDTASEKKAYVGSLKMGVNTHETFASVKEFQKQSGYEPQGEATFGDITYEKMFNAEKKLTAYLAENGDKVVATVTTNLAEDDPVFVEFMNSIKKK